MGKESKISWTDHTWNIAVGCNKVDEDCRGCYMYRDSMGGTRYNPLEIRRTKTVFNLPLKIKEPAKIFTCSLTDFFHDAIDDYRNEAWEVIKKYPHHTFQILTKRPERIKDCLPNDWTEGGYENVWLGTSIGNKKAIERVRDLIDLKINRKINTIFISAEPLHEEISLEEPQLHGITGRAIAEYLDWVIIGGESGFEAGKYKYRPCKLEWMEKLVNQCKMYYVHVFVKQMGTHLAKELNLKSRHGSDINEFPEHLRIQEFPFINNFSTQTL